MARTKKSTKASLSHVTVFNQPDCELPKSFFEGRFIPGFHPESLDYEQWWAEQLDRVENGWNDGGFSVTGVNYYHLNFKKIGMTDTKTNLTVFNHPYFSYVDQQFFNDVRDARAAGEGMILITGRGFGKSYNVATLVEHEFTTREISECIVSASTEKYVNLLWQKIESGLNSQPEELRRSQLVNKQTEIQSGYKEKDPLTNRYKDYDENAFIRKVTYDSDPEKTRGSRPSIHVWEEIGSWTGAASLFDCFRKTEPSWRRGSVKTTFPIFIGTGGAMDTGGSIDAKIMFNNPREYGLKVYKYEDREVGNFIPSYSKFGGFYEKSGRSDEEGAKKWLDAEREKKKKNPTLYRQETSEFPYTPEEAFQISGAGTFPVDILERRYAAIERTPALKKMVQRGNLNYVRKGSEITGVEWEADENGDFEILEHPEWTKKSWTEGKINHLYIGGCDSFDSVEEESERNTEGKKSPGSLFIFKRFYKASMTSRLFVAKITQRTDDATIFYENTVKLNMYYNCKMLAEYTKIGIFQHYITNRHEHMLYRRPRLDSTVIKESASTNRYGITMPTPVKRHVINRLVAYVKMESDQLYFVSQIRDMLSFTYEGHDKSKHDETMASALAVLGDDDMYKVEARAAQDDTIRFPAFRRDKMGNLVFN